MRSSTLDVGRFDRAEFRSRTENTPITSNYRNSKYYSIVPFVASLNPNRLCNSCNLPAAPGVAPFASVGSVAPPEFVESRALREIGRAGLDVFDDRRLEVLERGRLMIAGVRKSSQSTETRSARNKATYRNQLPCHEDLMASRLLARVR